MGPEAKECGQLQDATKSKKTDSPLAPLEGTQPCQHLHLWTYDLRTVRQQICGVLSHSMAKEPSQQP